MGELNVEALRVAQKEARFEIEEGSHLYAWQVARGFGDIGSRFQEIVAESEARVAAKMKDERSIKHIQEAHDLAPSWWTLPG